MNDLGPGGAVAEDLTHNPKVHGLTPATGTGRDLMVKNVTGMKATSRIICKPWVCTVKLFTVIINGSESAVNRALEGSI